MTETIVLGTKLPSYANGKFIDPSQVLMNEGEQIAPSQFVGRLQRSIDTNGFLYDESAGVRANLLSQTGPQTDPVRDVDSARQSLPPSCRGCEGSCPTAQWGRWGAAEQGELRTRPGRRSVRSRFCQRPQGSSWM